MTTLLDPRTGRFALVRPCKACRGQVYLSYTMANKSRLFDVGPQGEPTRTPHTCQNGTRWSELFEVDDAPPAD